MFNLGTLQSTRLNRHKGFTLVELLTVVTLIAILSALGAPAFNQMIAKNRIKNISSDLHLTMLKARSEAVKRNVPVTITPTGSDWKLGWTMTVAGPPVVTLMDRDGTDVKIHTTFAGNIVYLGSGRTQNAAGLAFSLYEDSDILARPIDRRCVTVSLSGMPTIRENICTGHTLP